MINISQVVLKQQLITSEIKIQIIPINMVTLQGALKQQLITEIKQ